MLSLDSTEQKARDKKNRSDSGSESIPFLPPDESHRRRLESKDVVDDEPYTDE